MDTQENNPSVEITVAPYHTPEDFVEVMIAMCEAVHTTAIDKGWWDNDNGLFDPDCRNMGEIVSNFHAEVSEFWESYRKPEREMSTQCEGFYNDEIELADLMIRVMDLAAAKDYRLAQAIVAKMEYNRTRPYRHGGKKA
jgi:hypothetical protein